MFQVPWEVHVLKTFDEMGRELGEAFQSADLGGQVGAYTDRLQNPGSFHSTLSFPEGAGSSSPGKGAPGKQTLVWPWPENPFHWKRD